MCGIAGIVFSNNELCLRFIQKMTDTLFSRGPDDSGIWLDRVQGLAFGHRRLAILDLSAAGHQPMHSRSGRFVITYNGEIYNYLEIGKRLLSQGHNFLGHSDTEVILAAFEEWGIYKSIELFDGMFAFAVWDKQDQKLYLARDKFGEKPLYYGWVDNSLIFGSELKALSEYKIWQPKINLTALNLFLRYSYVPAPYSIYYGISKLMPGTILEISADRQEKQFTYWSAQLEMQQAFGQNSQLIESDAVDLLHKHLSQAVQSRSMSDVPLGVFLSGGIDSSLIAALAQEQNRQPVKTFTIGFYENNFNNEAPFAKEIASYLGTNHTEYYVTEEEMQGVIEKLPVLYDEPFADSSQIPTHLLSIIARRDVTVCLSGDGGDELFCGYNRYVWLEKIYKKSVKYPRLTQCFLKYANPAFFNSLNRLFSNLLPHGLPIAFLGDKIAKLANVFMYANTTGDFYKEICSSINNPSFFLLSDIKVELDIDATNYHGDGGDDFIHWMMLMDTINYLPNDILTKVDRAAMGASLEVRPPFLNAELFKYAWSLPLRYKVKNMKNKFLLRSLLRKYLPLSLVERPKVGFGAPVGQWLKGPLRDWVSDLLNVDTLRQQGFFNAQAIQQHWQEHLFGLRDWTNLLWNFLMFEVWYKNNGKNR